MASGACGKPCGPEMAKVIAAIWPYSSATTRSTFAVQVLKITGGAVPDEEQLKAQILHSRNAITYNEMMTLIDTTVNNYQIGMVSLVDIAKQTTNSAKLDVLCELTLKALESQSQ